MRSLVLLVVAGCSFDIDPRHVSFGGRELDVDYTANVCLLANGVPVRCLGKGTLIEHDFTGDGVADLALYRDTRDGFRDTFAYLEIWKNDGTPLEQAPSERAKWKEGQWVWIDPAEYPGLTSPAFVRFMADRDAEH